MTVSGLNNVLLQKHFFQTHEVVKFGDRLYFAKTTLGKGKLKYDWKICTVSISCWFLATSINHSIYFPRNATDIRPDTKGGCHFRNRCP